MQRSVYQFAPNEVEEALTVLNTAIENHRIWFDKLHTSLVCHQPFSKDILDEGAHKYCEFGKWYYNSACDSIKSLKEFSKIEPAHKYMHSFARDLALLSENNKLVDIDEYQAFLINQRNLIELLTQLRDTLIEQGYCFDALTGAVNRRSISLLLEQNFQNFLRYKQLYSVAMLDLDHFKQVNDEHGHLAGDYVLKNICTYFRDVTRKSDIVGRYGGEEFLIIMPGTDKHTSLKLMEKICSTVSNEKMITDNIQIEVTISIGVSEVNSSDEDAWQAVKRADEALYQAKQSGRNQVKLN